MKDRITRKPTIAALIMCAALCLGACGESTSNEHDADASEDSAAGSGQEQESGTPAGNAEQAAENEDQKYSADSNDKTDTNVIVESPVTVVMETDDTVELTTDDGTVFYTITCGYPVVSIAGNDASAEKINADIRSRVESYHTAANQQAELAKEDFEYLLNDNDDEYMPFPYSSDLSFTVTRADDHVISFTETQYEYMGGAHGYPLSIGINYDTDTGELITFTDLSNDPDAFHADTLAYNQELARTEYYSMQMFSQDDITNGTLENVLYTDDFWYLSTSGLVFMSPPYELAPYAAGTLEFTIPYRDLADMGFNEAYAYTGRQIVKLIENNPYDIDLNGDGSEKSITFYNEWVNAEDGSYEVLTHLIVNDIDFVQEGTDDVIEQLTSPVSSQLAVYDLDVNDNYVELAAIFEEWTQNDGDAEPVSTQYSRIFRYMEDGSLTYLGQADADVTDPAVSHPKFGTQLIKP